MIPLDINGKRQNVDVPGDTPLLWALRDELGLTGTKFGCGMALCGACTVHVDGQPVRSCITPISAVGEQEDRHHRRRRRATRSARRCRRRGSTWACRSAATARPARSCPRPRCSSATPKPTDAEIDEAMSGNICRCGTYTRIRAAIKQAAAKGAAR